jgi:hypothetical protein
MWDFKETEKKEREARIAWLKEHAPGFEDMIHGLDIGHASHSLIVAAGVLLMKVSTEQMVNELRETIFCETQARLTRKPMKLFNKGYENEESQKWAYLAALHAHRAVMILANNLVEKRERIINALIGMRDYYVAESVLGTAHAATIDWYADDD